MFLVNVMLAIAVSFAFLPLQLDQLARLPRRAAHRRRARNLLLRLHHPRPLLPGLAADARVRDTVPEHAAAPVDVFVGATTGTELVATLAMQVGWAVVLLAACLAAFSRGTQKLVVQGG